MTRAELVQQLRPLGLQDNNVLVHASLDAFSGAGVTPAMLCEALIEAVGSYGTIVMPAFTWTETAFSDGTTPIAFRPESPVSPSLGSVAETFRLLPGVMRSNHPSHSFASYGRYARDVLSTQRDNNPLGPAKKLNVLQGYVLLLGASLRAATVIHLAEEGAAVPYLQRGSALRMNASGFEERVILEHVPGCGIGFERLEARLDPEQVAEVALPQGRARKIPIRYLVRLAAEAVRGDPFIFVCEQGDCRSCAGKRAAVNGGVSLAV
jgi:aminoglycoside N3'-acetyltransferase